MWAVPFDQEDILHNVFNLPIGPKGEWPNGEISETDCWHILQFNWDLEKRQCRVLMDNCELAVLPQLRQSTGICYLRLRSVAKKTDTAGFLIDSVACDVGK